MNENATHRLFKNVGTRRYLPSVPADLHTRIMDPIMLEN